MNSCFALFVCVVQGDLGELSTSNDNLFEAASATKVNLVLCYLINAVSSYFQLSVTLNECFMFYLFNRRKKEGLLEFSGGRPKHLNIRYDVTGQIVLMVIIIM